MKIRKINFIFLLLFLICLNTKSVFASCNFKSSDYLEKLNNTSQIEKIEIDIDKYRKWTKNALDTIKSVEVVQEVNKKRFNSKVKVFYKFGICEYEANVRLHGDKKDHIDLNQGKLRASLDINLKNGNIKNATKFKLLLPETRKGNNEIFTTIFLRKLGFIAPETFIVKTKLNDSEYVSTFQEKATKELLEKNNKIEGPIFEGDEEILWINKKKFSKYENFQLEKFSASRLTNSNWALKNTNSSLITLKSFIKLQKTYFEYSLGDGAIYMNPNNEKNNLFSLYDIALMSMNGFHGLRPHNRKFYYNIQDNLFEPIYYDGSIIFKKNHFSKNYLRFLNNKDLYFYSKFLKTDDIQKLSYKIKKIDIKNLIEEYHISSNLKNSEAQEDVEFFIKIINQNLKLIKTLILDYEKTDDKEIEAKNWKEEIIRLEKIHNFNQLYLAIENINLKNKEIRINCLFQKNCLKDPIDFDKLVHIMQRNNVDGKRAIIFHINENIEDEKIKIIKNIFTNEYIFSSLTADIKFDKVNRAINLIQNYEDDWFLIKDQKLKNIKINFEGVKRNQAKNNFQRINSKGLTGCLTLYKVEFDQSNILANDGKCEDSINIIASKGKINKVLIKDAYSDALDSDFSNLEINYVEVENSLNDCSDFSFGNYRIEKIRLSGCGDKGISVGEGSSLTVSNAFIKKSDTGVASKDSSKAYIKNAVFNEIQTCLSVYNKKEEFFGARINIKKFECKNYYKLKKIGKNSSIVNNL